MTSRNLNPFNALCFFAFFSLSYFGQSAFQKQYEFPLLSNAFRKVIFPQGDGGSKYLRSSQNIRGVIRS